MRFRTIVGRVRAVPMLTVIAFLLIFTACDSNGSNTATTTNANPISVNSPTAMAPAIPTASPQTQNKAVQPTANAPGSQIGTGGNDFFVFTKVRSALDSDSDVKKANITIEVKAGVVTLSGAVANAEQKSKAEQLVSQAEGVKDVKSRLRIVK